MNYKILSKAISKALRHSPEKFGIILDEEGWTSLSDLIGSLRIENRHWHNLMETDIQAMMAEASKQRFEVKEGRIRALYGHSIAQKISKVPSKPPAVLYHGTARRAVHLIKKSGLKSMNRQYVHLSADIETATMVGRRKDGKPIILEIDALEAYHNGIAFYLENNQIWLAEPIPAAFIEFGR